MATKTKELTLDDLYRIKKTGISRDVTDKELFELVALAREALKARRNKQKALQKAYDGADVEGDHHKRYVIDQMVHAITGRQDDETKEYIEWVGCYNCKHSGWNDFQWNTGIPY